MPDELEWRRDTCMHSSAIFRSLLAKSILTPASWLVAVVLPRLVCKASEGLDWKCLRTQEGIFYSIVPISHQLSTVTTLNKSAFESIFLYCGTSWEFVARWENRIEVFSTYFNVEPQISIPSTLFKNFPSPTNLASATMDHLWQMICLGCIC